MPRLDCTHESIAPAKLVCSHLLPVDEKEYRKVFTGRGREYHLACMDCTKDPETTAIPWLRACDVCFAAIETEGYWEGVRGRPEAKIEASNLFFIHRDVALSGMESDTLRIVKPVPHAPGSIWIGLTTAGMLIQLDLEKETFQRLTEVLSSDINREQFVSLVCAPDASFVCLTETLGNTGVVIERDSGRRTMRLQREGYRSGVSPFPAAFIRHEERTLLVHGTGWNRLDVSDPATGELLTDRSPTSYHEGEQRPAHYLDYFHCGLTPSPNNDFIAGNGWVWHPVGVVCTWSMRHWLTKNVWESEDGPTRKELAYRHYFWNGPLCWIDDHTLAVWGEGTDEENLLPAARMFDVVSGNEIGVFSGPEIAEKAGRDWRTALADHSGWMTFDRYLFAVSAQFGTGVWDPVRGVCLHQDPALTPSAYHPTTKEFLSILPNGSLQLSRLAGEKELSR